MERRDYEFNSAFSNVLIYVFRINDDAHKGYLKIGKATIKTDRATVPTLVPNCSLLNKAAKARIDQYTKTANVAYDLLYTELAVRPRKDDPTRNEYFMDTDVHKVLLHSNIKRKETDGAKEWFECNLETVKNAINAARHHEYSLTPGEVSTTRDPIVFRPEQEKAIDETKKCFKTHNKMLWNAKMRFGKTLTSLQVVKDLKFKKTIIITHRPVVKGSWGEDFEKIFFDVPDWHYIKKDTTTPDVEPEVNSYIKGDKPFVLFASMQDLRGSKDVGGKFDKNELIFKTNWDCVIVDEAHEGTKTSLGDNVLSSIIKADTYGKTKVIYLSGTPFNLVEDFEESEVFTWDYVMEQTRKAEWDIVHRLDPNPYENLPVLYIYTYDLAKEIRGFIEAEDRAFNFKEFFRVWTGKAKQDGKSLRDERLIGKFVHEDEVRAFLDLLANKTVNSNYPYSREIYRDYFRHSLWMLPGVKEAKALSDLLHEHPIFRGFGIANVAGDGDEEQDFKDALAEVNKKITKHPEKTYTITLSCGRLTTGVTVPPWTAVLMLAGSYSVSASNYLQTIFRVQSPANIDGQIKDKCFVFDFAPDRTLKMVAEAGKLSTRPGKNDESSEKQMGDLLNFCPVISIEGSLMTAYDVDSMLQQIKRIYAERVVRNGFDDPKLYNDKLLHLTELEISKFEGLKKVVGASKASEVDKNIVLADAGLTNQERELIEKAKKKRKTDLTEEEKERLEKLKKAKEERGKAISILRAISIRIPLMIYGAEIPFDEDITIENFIDLVDDQSWVEFMPNKVTKDLFREFMQYYDKDIFIAAGKSIRALVKGADDLDPTSRVKRISEVFRMFKNPDKETVLTPWRVVNMHMSETLGGWDFFAKDHQEPLDEPRFVDCGEVTRQCLSPNSRVLEINSKSGLYPLYLTYSIFRERCNAIPEDSLTAEMIQKIWQETLYENVFVICKTPMAVSITKRTLLGYKTGKTNAHYFDDLINQFKHKSGQVVEKITRKSYWKKGENGEMNFDAIVGNPPYQEMGGSGGTNDAPVYQHFGLSSEKINPSFISLIVPARWFSGGRESLLGEYRQHMIRYGHVMKMLVYPEATDVFSTVEIKSGICIYLQSNNYVGLCDYNLIENGNRQNWTRNLADLEVLVRHPIYSDIVKKVWAIEGEEASVESIFSGDTPFGIGTKPEESKKSPIKLFDNPSSSHNTLLLYYEKGQRKTAFVNGSSITKNSQDINKVKVFIPKAGGSGNDSQVLGKPELFLENSVCSQTFIYAPFHTKTEAENFILYLKTKFLRALVASVKISQDALSSVYRFVPMQDFSRNSDIDWTKLIKEIDRQLYIKYKLTPEEIAFIEEKIQTME